MIAAYGLRRALARDPRRAGLEQTLERVQEMVAEYDGLAEEPIVPALAITTIASSEPGGDGDFSELGVEGLREWVGCGGRGRVRAGPAAGHHRLPHPGEALRGELLTAPHVGPAPDAEWRLEPGQKHLEQIGLVTAAENNEVSTWLADLTAQHGLPQKVLILHHNSMTSDRQDRGHPPGPRYRDHRARRRARHPEDKLATWNALQQDLPGGSSWRKNFHDEDTLMFTPEETYALEPRPGSSQNEATAPARPGWVRRR